VGRVSEKHQPTPSTPGSVRLTNKNPASQAQLKSQMVDGSQTKITAQKRNGQCDGGQYGFNERAARMPGGRD